MTSSSYTNRHLLVVGATGLVGEAFLQQCAAIEPAYKMSALVRSPGVEIPSSCVEMVAPSDEWPELIERLQPDTVFCALGTTIRKAGSRNAFHAVDFTLVHDVGMAAKRAGASHFIAVSSVGADARASSFYLKTKGETEEALIAEGFDRLDLLRPGLLRGPRREFRLGEQFGVVASPVVDCLMQGAFKKFRSVHADQVALAALRLVEAEEKGVYKYDSEQIHALAS